jgi:thiol:disulfide interchange protein DsbG
MTLPIADLESSSVRFFKHLLASARAGLSAAIGFSIAVSAAAATETVDRKIWEDVLSLQAIGAPRGNARISVFCDPNCPYCAELWTQIENDKRVAQLMRWIPVAYLDSSSAGRAGALLESVDQGKALRENFRNYSFASRRGGINALTHIQPSTQALLRKNTMTWRSLGGLTPLFFYRDTDGETRRQSGLPTSEVLRTILEKSQPLVLKKYSSPKTE